MRCKGNIDDADAEVHYSEDDCDSESDTSCVKSLVDGSGDEPEVKKSVQFSDEVALHTFSIEFGCASGGVL